MQQQPSTLEEVYAGNRRECAAHGLALDAAGISYAVWPRATGYVLVVSHTDAERARRELQEYDVENPVPVTTHNPSHAGNGWIGVAGYALVLTVFAALEQNGVFSHDWHGAGALNARLVRAGQWWRVVTALTLHEDLAHLLSNMLIGGLIGLFVGQLLGSGLAWVFILVAGGMGNFLSALFRPDNYTAIGASTAVFAALGIPAGVEWTRRRRSPASMAVRYAPLMGGAVLLSMLGTGGERTDVISHVLGFFCGLVLGAVYGKLGQGISFGRAAQIAWGLSAVALMALSWALGLSREIR